MSTVSLRPATRQDIDRMYRWRCDEDIYRWFRNQNEELDWHDHVDWWRSRSEERQDLIIENRSRAVGVVAIAADGDVGVYIGEKDMWGRGIASEALSLALSDVRRELSAEIHEENHASIALFEAQGFEQVGQEGDWLQYRRPKPRPEGFPEGDWDHGLMQGERSWEQKSL